MTYEHIISTALAQSAIDLGCRVSDLISGENHVVRSQANPLARKYLSLPFACNLVSYGGNVVASVSEEMGALAYEYINSRPWYHCFETPDLLEFNDKLSAVGCRLRFMAEYFLPDPEMIPDLTLPYRMVDMQKEDFANLYKDEWSNALSSRRPWLDTMGVGAYDGEQLVGLAACSADCDEMYQIGIDVLPDYRRQGIASALTSALAKRIISVGKVPFYCAAWSNIPSVKNAVRSGFRPAWVELTAVRIEAD